MHENDALLARPAPSPVVQMALPIEVKSEPPALTPEQRMQRENLNAFFAQCRADTAIYLAVVQARYPEAGYTSLKAVSTQHLEDCHAEYAAHPFRPGRFTAPHPEAWPDARRHGDDLAASRVPAKPQRKRAEVYQPWTRERRQRQATANLLQRYRKRYSLFELWCDKAQADLLKDPARFGVCPLPSEGTCNIPDPERELRRRNAIALEVQFREQEQGLVMPINLAQPVPQREYEYALAQPTQVTTP